MRGRNGLRSPPAGLFCHGLRSPRGAPLGGLLLHGRSPRGAPPAGLLLHGLRSRGPAGLKPPPPLARLSGERRRGSPDPCERGCATPDLLGGFPVHGRVPLAAGLLVHGRSPRGAPPAGLLLQGRSPRGASPDGLLLHGFRRARGPVGLVCHGRSLGGAPPAGLSRHGLRSRGFARLKPCATSDLSGGFPVHGRSPRGGPSLSRSRCVAGSFSDHARSGRFFFLNRSRGSLCVPPGRQSGLRFS